MRILLIFLLAGFLLYGRGIFGQFIGDDENLIINNQQIVNISNWPNFFMGGNFAVGGSEKLAGIYYKPLYSLVLSLIVNIFGLNPIPFHIIQIFIHCLNTYFVYLLFKRFFHPTMATFLGLIFLVHPMNVESVAYISGIQEPLFLLFGLLALNYVIYKKTSNLFVINTLLLGTLLTKETGVLFVLTTMIYLHLFKRVNPLRILLTTISSVLVYIFLRFGVAHLYFNEEILSPIMALPLNQRLLHIPQILFFYFSTYFFPKNLIFSQTWILTKITLANFYGPLVVSFAIFATIISFSLFLYKKNKIIFNYFIFFNIILFSGLLLHLQIFPLDSTVSDRWFYFPQIGLLGAIAIILSIINNQKKLKLVCILILLLLVVRTFLRIGDWKNETTLVTHDIKLCDECFSLDNLYSHILIEKGDYVLAEKYIARSVDTFPYFLNYNNLGVFYFKTNQQEKALIAYKKSLEYGEYFTAYENIAGWYTFNKKYPEGIKFAKNSLLKFPYNAKILLYLAIDYYQMGDVQAALQYATLSNSYNQTPESTYTLQQIANKGKLKIVQ